MAVHIYTGDGKGKTTCAAGLAARCAGHRKSVSFYQFLKCDESGECRTLSPLVRFFRVSMRFGFVFQMDMQEKEKLKQETYALWKQAVRENCDLLVLDEIFGAMEVGFIPKEEVFAFIKTCKSELVLTGRNAPENFVKLADYVTEMKMIKHVYEKGIAAREGIEY